MDAWNEMLSIRIRVVGVRKKERGRVERSETYLAFSRGWVEGEGGVE